MVYLSNINIGNQDFSPFGEQVICQKSLQINQLFPNTINQEITKISLGNTGNYGWSNYALRLTLNGASDHAVAESTSYVSYSAGTALEYLCVCKCEQTPVLNNIVRLGIGNASGGYNKNGAVNLNGFFFNLGSSNIAVIRAIDGVLTAVEQVNFNADKLDGSGTSGMTLTTTNSNIYRIRTGWLSVLGCEFAIFNPTSRKFVTCHRFSFANQNTTRASGTPFFQTINGYFSNDSASTVAVQIPSCAVYKLGQNYNRGIQFSSGITKSITTEVPILTLRNNLTFGGSGNFISLILNCISIASDGAKSVIVNVYKNADLTGASYSNINVSTSISAIDITASAFANGRKLLTYALSKVDTLTIDLLSQRIILSRGDTITITAVSSATNDVTVGLTFAEFQ